MAGGSEFDIIARYFKPLACADEGALGLRDDAALLDIPQDQHLVVTSDALVSGVHFLATQSPQDIAYKVVAVNLSDLAAMGAAPRAVFLAAQFPSDITEDWIAAFSTGLGKALAPSGAVLMGGDTVGTPGPLAFTLTALGLVKKGQALTRAGANVGDVLYVSGTIGDGALGLLCLTGKLEPNAHLASRYTRPQPRLALGQALAQRDLATACIDVSDGLIADVGHICETSGLSIIIEAAAVPRSEACAAFPKLLNLVLGGGDDFELAFCVRPDNIAAIEVLSVELDMPLTRIGVCVEKGTGVSVFDSSGQVMNLDSLGYKHF